MIHLVFFALVINLWQYLIVDEDEKIQAVDAILTIFSLSNLPRIPDEDRRADPFPAEPQIAPENDPRCRHDPEPEP
jgi:hypothetical protein